METISNSRALLSKHKRNTNIQLPRTIKQAPSQTIEDKLVYFNSEDQYIKKILIHYGWKITKNQQASTLFWVYHLKHNTFSQLPKHFIINHFPHSYLLTTKLGLCKTLKGQKAAFVNSFGKSHSAFYPRSYDLRYSLVYKGSEENEEFLKDFKQTAILNLLKKMMVAIEIQNQALFEELHSQTMLFPSRKKDYNWVKSLEVLYETDSVYVNSGQRGKSIALNGKIFQAILWYFSLKFTLDSENTQQSIDTSEIDHMIRYSLLDPPYKSLEEHYEGNQALIKYPSMGSLSLFFGLYREAMNRFKWFRADGLRNVWVVKANDSSRGRNIILISSLQQLRSHNSGTKLIQKYVEDAWIYRQSRQNMSNEYPFLKKMAGKKFDMRIWVLVRSFAPLSAFIYKEGYLRISQEAYQLSELDRNCTHLTNFSVNWKSSQADPQNSYVLLSEFLEYLDQSGIKKKSQMTKQIQDIVRHTLQTTDLFVSRSEAGCFQLYGYDIILDSQLKPWLLEVNMSPACKERGRLAQELQVMGSGLLSLVGIVPKNAHQMRWVCLSDPQDECYPLHYNQEMGLKISQRLSNELTKYKSQSTLKPVLSKCFSVRSGKEEDTEISRVSTILPAIANGILTNVKLQKLSTSSLNCELMLIGHKLYGKKLRRVDKFVNRLNAVGTLERNYHRLMKNTSNNITSNIGKKPSLQFLRLIECLIMLQHKAKRRGFKQIRKFLQKRSIYRKHYRLN